MVYVWIQLKSYRLIFGFHLLRANELTEILITFLLNKYNRNFTCIYKFSVYTKQNCFKALSGPTIKELAAARSKILINNTINV